MRKLVATFCLVFILPLQGAFFSLVRAQGGITSDGSLGTQVTQNGNVHTITGGTRPGGGSNLFHSFGEFGVPTDNIANFLNDAVLPTTNILSRVTGGNPSNILGTIQTEGFGNANLFLMNPAGIVFGPNASLNVGGATHFTTADYLQLADGVQFTALPSLQDALLSVAPIEAFGFLESNPASLSVDGSMLTVKDGETLSLVGGDIDISGGSLKSADGQINLVSLNSPGTVNFGENGGLQVQATQLGNIGLSDNAAINVNGESGGSIIIRGGQLMLDGSRISANATGSPSTAMGDSTPAGMAGASEYGIDIGVTQDVVLDNGSFVVANVGGSMNGRDIKVMAGGDLEIRHSTVQTQTTTNGTAGNIEIHANNLVFNIDKPNQSLNDLFGISSFTTGSGDAGNLQLQTNSFDMVGGFLATFTGGSGNAGNIELTVTKDISIFGGRGGGNIVTNAVPLGPGPPPSGNAGNLSIHATNLTMAGDSQIQAVTAVGPGKGGNIQVILTGGLELQEASQVGTFSAGGSVGDAGDILISADNVSLIGVENPTPDGNFFGNQTLITASTTGAGKGGTINIEAGNVVITNKAAINTSTSGTGDGGNINVSAKNFNLTNGGHVRAVSTSTSQDSGDAGNFVINAAETILLDKATMTAESAQSSGEISNSPPTT